MEIDKALQIIKKALKKKVLESKHFLKQCEKRDIDIKVIRAVVQENKILGIVEQSKSLYKIWFSYEQHKDLNIIVKIIPLIGLRFVTVFPCYSERRTR